ncbi:MAG: hypothetical protein JO332_17905 [Planctomycetaceae bacterium]|nr:hypothetical protein [Planctomycetaceae bacterium]
MNVFLILCLSVLTGADDGDLGGSVPAAKAEVEGIVKHETTIRKILTEAEGAMTAGKNVQGQAGAVEQAFKGAGSPQAREEAAGMLQYLESQKSRQVLEQRAKVNVNIDKWKAFAARAVDNGGSEGAASSLSGAWDGAGAAGGTPSRQGPQYFTGSFTGPTSMYGTHRRLQGQADGLRSGIEQSKGALGQIDSIQAAAVRNGEQRKSLEQQAAAILKEKAVLAQQQAAAGNPEEIRGQMAAIERDFKALDAQNVELGSRMDGLAATIKARNTKIDELDRFMRSDPNFYNNHRSECELIREWTEGQTRHWEFWYIPEKRLIDQNKADRATWDQLNAQHVARRNQMDAQSAEWQKLKKRLDAAQLKQRIEQLDVRHKETLGEIDKLKLEGEELRSRLSRLVDELRRFSRRLRDWVSEAEQAVKDAREGR